MFTIFRFMDLPSVVCIAMLIFCSIFIFSKKKKLNQIDSPNGQIGFNIQKYNENLTSTGNSLLLGFFYCFFMLSTALPIYFDFDIEPSIIWIHLVYFSTVSSAPWIYFWRHRQHLKTVLNYF